MNNNQRREEKPFLPSLAPVTVDLTGVEHSTGVELLLSAGDTNMKGCGPALRKTTPTTPSRPWWDTSPLSEETVSELSLEVVAALQVS